MPRPNRQTQQQILSQTLNLLESTNYQDPQAIRSNVDRRTDKSNDEIRILDTIALCISTGRSGDVVASAIKYTDKGEMIIYLARNGEPVVPKDVSSASDLLNKLRASKHQSMLDILPWVASHGPEKVQKRVNKLRELVSEDKNGIFRRFLNRQIKNYHISLQNGIKAEFPDYASGEYLKSAGYDIQHIQVDSSTVQAILMGILKKFDEDLIFDTRTSSHSRFQSLVLAATTLRKSLFLKDLLKTLEYASSIDAPNPFFEKASQFYRNVNKVSQYIRIIDLIQYVQREMSCKIQWVYGTNMGNTLCHESQRLELQSASTTALETAKQLKLPIQPTSEQLLECFRKMNPFRPSAQKENPLVKRRVNTCVHAELKLIVFLLSITPQRSQDQEIEHRPIGCSKRSCLYCTFWIDELREILKPTVHRFIYYTAGSHGSPYATCARVGPFREDLNELCSNRVEVRLRGLVNERVKVLFNLSEQGHIKKKSEDHASASEDESGQASNRF
ncbi:hypothetical protein J132_08198 [Termitomyces sp. J132]|nr:hypothetical protein H2248_001971 [Termitomyces sp. 'cryptogamus']KNZ78973.1 hypothetical protein J132_08198 [Termitomyces sp. J132]